YHGDFLADTLQFLFWIIGDVFSGGEHASGIGLKKTHHDAQADGFTHTAAAKDADCLVGEDFEAHTIEYQGGVKRYRDVLEFQIGFALTSGNSLRTIVANDVLCWGIHLHTPLQMIRLLTCGTPGGPPASLL